MKIFLSYILAILLLLPIVGASGVTRSLSSESVIPEGILTVTLSVDVSGASDYYAIDEIYPSGWSVIDSGLGSTEHAGHWKHLVLENAQNTQLTYTLQAPSELGTHYFSGEYMFGGTQAASAITGQDTVTVTSSNMDVTGIVLLVVIVLIVAVLIVFKKFR